MGSRDLDLSFYKYFPMGEVRRLRLEVACYNVTNQAQLGMPQLPSITNVKTQPSVAASFGTITSTVNTPRQFQFGARYVF
jgi:hypothetical protein